MNLKSTGRFSLVVVALSLLLNDNNNKAAATRGLAALMVENSSSGNDIINNDINIPSAARAWLKTGGGGGLVECWSALLELKSCSNEIVLFFLNGQTNIGPDCCRAVGFIARNCWPAMLSSLGFTLEEGDILQGYCDALAASPPPIIGPSPPPLAHPPVALPKSGY